ncbi:hypothetical protein AWJ20_1493 [Sugiyamaella lignohabitans]|uniref:Endonuclease/exonuclease/phosphatase domain-containing protein n=1 Tax=Sugiyamaella lignohabitans TaxID=796027 RepID=A0A167DRP3_9ASCO|nr:uncharacterized protein AWJ20_1493 [Sugiyamaella lignohabitans]ANB13211.1 hypothetical protein AWJ20_1493 [Sugiyamaella lignohabitans]
MGLRPAGAPPQTPLLLLLRSSRSVDGPSRSAKRSTTRVWGGAPAAGGRPPPGDPRHPLHAPHIIYPTVKPADKEERRKGGIRAAAMTRLIEFRIYTHNIRYDNRNPTEGEELWEKRRELVVASIRFHARTNAFVCLQEALHHQLEDIIQGLNGQPSHGNWSYFGVGRDDGKTRGEYAPVLYRTDEWELIDGKTTWLSETPDKPSRGWDAALPRILTWTKFRNKSHGGITHICNTHFDHAGPKAREESAKLIIERIPKYSNNGPTVLVGDFNSTDSDNAYSVVATSLRDTSKVVAPPDRYGHTLTYTGFNESEPCTRIDYVWVTKDVTPISYGVQHNRYRSITYSDHRPVIADVQHKAR